MAQSTSGPFTFLFTDIEDASTLLRRLGRVGYDKLLADQRLRLRQAAAAHGGEELEAQPDGFLVAFGSAADAVKAAVAVQDALADEGRPDLTTPRVRMGVHTGEAAASAEHYLG